MKSGVWARVGAWAILLLQVHFPALGAQSGTVTSLTLAWDPSPDPSVIGYKLYWGGQALSYTNVLDVGNATTAGVSNLAQGSSYYFAVTAYDSNNLESAFSGEINYTVPITAVIPQISLALGPLGLLSPPLVSGSGKPGDVLEVLASGDLLSWQVLGSVTVGLDGTFQYPDLAALTNPARFYRLRFP